MALRALAVKHVERKIAAYHEQVQGFEKKYNRTLEEHTRLLEGKASIEEEDELMERKEATVMLEAWQKAFQEVLVYPGEDLG